MSGVFRQGPGRGEGDRPACTEHRGGRPGIPIGPRLRPVLDGKGARPGSLLVVRVRERYRMAETRGSVSRARDE